MHIETFETHDEMLEAVERNRKAALDGLHPAQASLDLGSHWVRFVDLGANPPIVEFGRVATETEIYNEAEGTDTTESIAAERTRLRETGLMYGLACSLLGEEWGYTHKSMVWPINVTLFGAAEAAGWRIDKLDDAGRLLLEHAYQSHRNHYLGGAHDPHDQVPAKPTREEVLAVLSPYYGPLTSTTIDKMADDLMALINRG